MNTKQVAINRGLVFDGLLAPPPGTRVPWCRSCDDVQI
jgi:hypothetical protein